MKLFHIMILIGIIPCYSHQEPSISCASQEQCQEALWLVVGDGPAGIVTIGVLLDLGISPNEIVWAGPRFQGGRLELYAQVPGNAHNKLFVDFLTSCATFNEVQSPAIERLKSAEPTNFELLNIILEPLIDITNHLRKRVRSIEGWLQALDYTGTQWKAKINENTVIANYVVLATGSHPRTLDYGCAEEIPLDQALDKQQLKEIMKPHDIYAVIGGSHSGVLTTKNLYELNAKTIYLFYNKPLTYAIDMGSWTLNPNSGLKGATAAWAREVLEKNQPATIIRVPNTPENLRTHLPCCNKIIYAMGYERNILPYIKENPELAYDTTTGIIAPRLFGIGIAFPEKCCDPLGNVEHRIGLNSFLSFAQRAIPEWMQQRTHPFDTEKALYNLERFAELFEIDLL